MKVLGLSFDYHDAAAALICNGSVIAAAQEERFSRIKHDASFPEKSIDFCLESSGILPSQLDAVIHYENPFLKFNRILKTTSPDILRNVFPSWAKKGKFEVKNRIYQYLNIPKEKIFLSNHHESHAAAAYYCSPFNKATVITLDGAGEFETMTISIGEGPHLNKIHSAELPNSLGLLYSAFTAFLGFEVNEGEYKVMGMSAFGKPNFYEQVKSLVKFDKEGVFRLEQDCFDFFNSTTVPYTRKLESIFGDARPEESRFDVGILNAKPENRLQERSRHYADIASSLQKVTEEIILEIVEFGIAKTGIKNVCLAGGVALNSLANGKIQKRVDNNLYIHPAAGDAGSSLGAALSYYYRQKGMKKTISLDNPYLGRDYRDDEVLASLRTENIKFYKKYDKEDDLLKFVSHQIAQGKVIGWSQGRFEWGPRALGARSILANPTLRDMQLIVNEKIKFREPFRPFAPSVLEEKAQEYFCLSPPKFVEAPEFFMLSVADVKENKKKCIPAVTHVDGTARLQLVRKETNPRYYRLIQEFEKISGVPILLNTSFNLKGEPVVASPLDALKTFLWCDMDFVIINDFVIGKAKF